MATSLKHFRGRETDAEKIKGHFQPLEQSLLSLKFLQSPSAASWTYAASAIVTSTSTPGSMLMEVICLTISEGECRSMTRLWILIWNLSQVLEPSPQGVFLVVILRVLVGILTGPFTFSSLSLAPLIRSWQTFSRDFTFLEVRVILILWTGASSSTPLVGILTGPFTFSSLSL